MKKLLSLFVLSVIFTSCGLFKSSVKSKIKSSSKESSIVSTNKDSVVTKIDRTVTIESELADTTVITKPIEINTSKAVSFEDIVNGLTAVDTGLVMVKIQYDNLTGTLHTNVNVKPQNVDLKFNKRKETRNDISESTNTNARSNSEYKKENKNTDHHIEKKPAKTGVLMIVIIVVAFIVVGALFLYFRKRRLAAEKAMGIISKPASSK